MLVRSSKLETKDACYGLFHVSDAILSHLPGKWPASGAANWSNGRHISKERDEQVLGKFPLSLSLSPDRLTVGTFSQPPWRVRREKAFADSSLRSIGGTCGASKRHTFEWPCDYPADGPQIQFSRVGCTTCVSLRASQMSASGDAADGNLIFALSAARLTACAVAQHDRCRLDMGITQHTRGWMTATALILFCDCWRDFAGLLLTGDAEELTTLHLSDWYVGMFAFMLR